MKMLTRFFVLLTATIFMSSCSENNHSIKHKHGSANRHIVEKVKEDEMTISKPRRVIHTYEQTINGAISEIFPLYCPVRELEWCENWNPKVVYSNSGVVEQDCIFTTQHGEHETTWFVTDYDIEKGHVEMTHHTPGILFVKLEINVEPISDKKTRAIITYSKTSLSDVGDDVLKGFTKESYDIMMDSWEKAMNHFLKTGEMLTGLPNF